MPIQPVATPAVPKAPTTPKTAPVKSSMGGGILSALRASAAAQHADTAAQIAPLKAEIDARSQSDEARLQGYTQQMARINVAMQRQRLVTINRAQILKKLLPVVGLFALVAGKSDGIEGAIAALGGGLAGLSQGIYTQYNRAWKQFSYQNKMLIQQAKDTQAEMSSVLNDQSKTMAEKIDLLKVAAGSNKAYQQALQTPDLTFARISAEFDKQDARIEAMERMHDQASRANRPASQDEVSAAMNAAFPFTAKPTQSGADPQATAWFKKYHPNSAAAVPDAGTLGTEAMQAFKAAKQAGGNSPANKAAAAITLTKAPTESDQRRQWASAHQFAAMQIATIANAVAAQKGWDWPTAMRNVVNYLRAHNLIESDNIDDARVERGMESESD